MSEVTVEPRDDPLTSGWSEGAAAALAVVEDNLPPSTSEGVAVAVENVHVSFGGVRALRGATLGIESHSFTGILGPNGSGKTTMFDVIGGYTVPDEGSVALFGRDVTDAQPYERARLGVSRTFQANHIDPTITVYDNLIIGAFLGIRGGVLESTLRLPRVRRDEKRADDLVRAVARLMDLEPVLGVRAGSLSFGGQRRTEIGRSIVSRPQVLFLDEPSAGMDAVEAEHLIRLVTRLQKDLGLTVCLIEHFVRMVFEHCETVIAMAEGRVITTGTPEEIAANREVQAHYLGDPEAHRVVAASADDTPGGAA